MHIALKISILLTGILAAYPPAVYGALTIFYFDLSAIIDLLIVGGCVIIAWDAFRSVPRFMWIASFIALLIATSIGFFHYFQDAGESGPLPYEWLNGYYKFTIPLIALCSLNHFFRWRMVKQKRAKS